MTHAKKVFKKSQTSRACRAVKSWAIVLTAESATKPFFYSCSVTSSLSSTSLNVVESTDEFRNVLDVAPPETLIHGERCCHSCSANDIPASHILHSFQITCNIQRHNTQNTSILHYEFHSLWVSLTVRVMWSEKKHENIMAKNYFVQGKMYPK